ncbi:unnamed protein product, partial [Iphiclides podalirius]
MVFLTRTVLAVKDIKVPRKYLRSKFIDSVRLHVKGGTGGTGLPKFGGLGGQGGCVYCVGNENANLRSIVSKYRAKTVNAGHGEDSRKTKIVGNPGADVKLEVPLGVTIYREDGNILGSIDKEGETVIVARGGPGGNPDNNFLGHFGQIHHVRLDLKLIADIGLVGFPNADIIGISALKGSSIDELKQLVRKRLDEFAEENNPHIVEPSTLFKRNRAIVREKGPKIT